MDSSFRVLNDDFRVLGDNFWVLSDGTPGYLHQLQDYSAPYRFVHGNDKSEWDTEQDDIKLSKIFKILRLDLLVHADDARKQFWSRVKHVHGYVSANKQATKKPVQTNRMLSHTTRFSQELLGTGPLERPTTWKAVLTTQPRWLTPLLRCLITQSW
jgi:hypothetical protein